MLKKIIYLLLMVFVFVIGCSEMDGGRSSNVFGDDYRVLVNVPEGNFTQNSEYETGFVHSISEFNIGKYEVTYDLWYEIYTWATNNGYSFQNPGGEGWVSQSFQIGATPSSNNNKYKPVTRINWRDVIVWCNAYSEKNGYQPIYCSDMSFSIPIRSSLSGSYSSTINSSWGGFDNPYVKWIANGFRLPTEGEWQYAASYKDGVSWTLDDSPSGVSGLDELGDVAWYIDNSNDEIHPVGLKLPNQLGLYDMNGNSEEWCWDWDGDWPESTQHDYRGNAYHYQTSNDRVTRGGHFYTHWSYCTVGYRGIGSPYGEASMGTGFRVVRCP